MSAPSLCVLVVDDEPLARHWLRVLLGKMPMPVEMAEAASAALATLWLKEHACHVVLLDIHMPGVDGLMFAKQCQQICPDVAIIFVTADSGHALEAFELHAFDYLTKPVTQERLEQALRKVRARSALVNADEEPALRDEPSITIEGQQSITKLALSTIVYFHSDSKYTEVVTKERTHLSEMSLNHLESLLGGHVVRVHRSFLVPVHAIKELQKAGSDAWELTLKDREEKISVSRRQLPMVKDALKSV